MIGDEELPDGWAEIALDKLLQSLESGSRPRGGVGTIKEGVPSLGGEHVDENGGFRFEAVKYVPTAFFESMRRGHIQIGDVLIVKDGATTGKVSLVRDDFPFRTAVVNEHVFVCRPAGAIHPAFLFYFLFSGEGQSRILENFRGSAQGGINQSFAPGTTVPLAPLAEQKRIVAKLEELLAKVNAARERLAKATARVEKLTQAILAKAFRGELVPTEAELARNEGRAYEPASALLACVQVHEAAKVRTKSSSKPNTPSPERRHDSVR